MTDETIRLVKTVREIAVDCCPEGLDETGRPKGAYVDATVPAGVVAQAHFLRCYRDEDGDQPIFRVVFLGYGDRDFFLSDFPNWFDTLPEM